MVPGAEALAPNIARVHGIAPAAVALWWVTDGLRITRLGGASW